MSGSHKLFLNKFHVIGPATAKVRWPYMNNNLRTFGISWYEVRETAEDSQSWREVMNNNLRMLRISWHDVLETE